MLKRILKRIEIEGVIAKLIGPRQALSLVAIIKLEWVKYRMRCRAVNNAVRAAL